MELVSRLRIPFLRRVLSRRPEVPRPALASLHMGQCLKNNPPVKVAQSTVSGGGEGLFARRDIAKGELVALYPGLYTPPCPLWARGLGLEPALDVPGADAEFRAHWRRSIGDHSDGAYVLCLNHTGGHVDAAPKVLEFLKEARPDLDYHQNGWAVAQFANHPPRGRPVAVEFLDFWLSDEHAPTQWTPMSGIAPGSPWVLDFEEARVTYLDCAPVACACFFALRDVAQGEEMFFDYRMQPAKRPEWYWDPYEDCE
mmetsp:Transcript_74822/g.171477  ORF Transcript_74822/g.171477 Transcript_74822/m.171477 type:complete len:255 (-) Transcript_74822:306-1070(-)